MFPVPCRLLVNNFAFTGASSEHPHQSWYVILPVSNMCVCVYVWEQEGEFVLVGSFGTFVCLVKWLVERIEKPGKQRWWKKGRAFQWQRVKRYQGRNSAKDILIGGKRHTCLGVCGKPGQGNNTEYRAPLNIFLFPLSSFSPTHTTEDVSHMYWACRFMNTGFAIDRYRCSQREVRAVQAVWKPS